MVGTFEVKQDRSIVGTVRVEEKGLYYVFRCKCNPLGDGMHHLVAVTEQGKTDLGICVPEASGFCVYARIPKKRLVDGKVEFLLLPKRPGMEGRFVPVYPEEPFAYLSKLKGAYLQTRGGQIGIVITQ